MDAITVELKQVSKAFGSNTVFNTVSAVFPGGSIHGIIGRNGSGKTVLLKCICGLLEPSSGSILFNGETNANHSINVGAVIETPGFIENMSGFQNLLYLARLRNKIGKDEIVNAMNTVGLSPELKKPVKNYSLGMRQRLGIAQAIMEHPQLLILDEPMNGLDSQGVADIQKLLLCNRQQFQRIAG